MILEPGDTNREVPVNETFHVQANDELTEKELKQIKADDQAIQTIILGLPEDIYADPYKGYANVRRKPMEFEVGDMVMLKVSPWKGVIRFEKRDENLVIPLKEIQLDDKLHFIEEPVEIMDREVKQLKQSQIPIVKVRWNSRRGLDYTWEREDFYKSNYPHMFSSNQKMSKRNRASGRHSGRM
nr:hypothetical protein [Tanacetum cinerariifolium]